MPNLSLLATRSSCTDKDLSLLQVYKYLLLSRHKTVNTNSTNVFLAELWAGCFGSTVTPEAGNHESQSREVSGVYPVPPPAPELGDAPPDQPRQTHLETLQHPQVAHPCVPLTWQARHFPPNLASMYPVMNQMEKWLSIQRSSCPLKMVFAFSPSNCIALLNHVFTVICDGPQILLAHASAKVAIPHFAELILPY